MRVYSYVVARDFGFAPNPFHGTCTLGTCKPIIRKTAQIGDWVIGTGAKSNYDFQGRLIFAMKVNESLTFDEYWSDPRFLLKRPVLNGSIQQMYGDNIYRKIDGEWVQLNSHHSFSDGSSNPNNVRNDTQTDRVLLSKRYVYYGIKAPVIPDRFKHFGDSAIDICALRGHKCNFPVDLVVEFVEWLEDREEWGLRGLPWEFKSHLDDSNIGLEF